MKKIRLKDRMWFGKYNGARISDVLLKDRKILDELCSKGIIEYDEKIINFLDQHYGKIEKKSFGYIRFEPHTADILISDPYEAVADILTNNENAI
jgi:hypothetical protein